MKRKYISSLLAMLAGCIGQATAQVDLSVTQDITLTQTIGACGRLTATNKVAIGSNDKVIYTSGGNNAVCLKAGFIARPAGNGYFKAGGTSTCSETVVKVLVLNFNPYMNATTRIIDYFKWQNPKELAQRYMEDVRTYSGVRVQHVIVDWRELNEFPALEGTQFRYDSAKYRKCIKEGGTNCYKDPYGNEYPANYHKIFTDHNVYAAINNGTVDEVWMFGGPYFSFSEFAMSGPGAFNINGNIYDVQGLYTNKRFAIMGPNYERTYETMVHNLSHRTERTMKRIYNSNWNPYPPVPNSVKNTLSNDWERFGAADIENPGEGGVGYTHIPVNGVYPLSLGADTFYKYSDTKMVKSTANEWYRFPNINLTNKTDISNSSWGTAFTGKINSYELGYLRWWFDHIPRAGGTNKRSGDNICRENNWWRYIYRINNYDERGRLRSGTLTCAAARSNSPTTTMPTTVHTEITVSVQPNPFTNELTISAGNLPKGIVQLQLTDMAGKVLYNWQWNIEGKQFKRNLSVPGLSPGSYLLRIQAGSFNQVQKLIRL